jgi:ATP-binding cassette, subfamily B, bacterial
MQLVQRQGRGGVSQVEITKRMTELTGCAASPLGFIFRYIRLRPISHAAILGAVLAAVACSVCTQYGIKFLVDTLAASTDAAAWTAFFLLGSLIAADNLLWRVASWIANYTFVGVTGDLRRDLFHYLMGHSPSYFSERLPGTLTSRVTATSNAVFTAENMFVWNVLPPCLATVAAIVLVLTISAPMAGTLAVIAGIMVCLMFPARRRGPAAASRIRPSRGRRRWRDDRRHRQYAAGARFRRFSARAPPFQRDG